jgi:hypothetical protein
MSMSLKMTFVLAIIALAVGIFLLNHKDIKRSDLFSEKTGNDQSRRVSIEEGRHRMLY